MKQRARLDIHEYFFIQRTVKEWNLLPQEVVDAKSVNQFKNRLDKFWQGYMYMGYMGIKCSASLAHQRKNTIKYVNAHFQATYFSRLKSARLEFERRNFIDLHD